MLRSTIRFFGNHPILKLISLVVLAGATVAPARWFPDWDWIPPIVVMSLACVSLVVLVAGLFGARLLRLVMAALLFGIVASLLVSGTEDITSGTVEVISGTADTTSDDALQAASHGVLSSIDRGGELRLAELLGADAIGLGRLEWIVLAIVAVLLWRAAEGLNASRSAMPIVVERFIVPGEHKEAERLTAQFETQLAYAGIAEPASVPGGAVADELIEIFGAEAGPTSWFSPVLRVAKLALPKRGSVVIPTLESDQVPRVAVRVVSARRRRTLHAQTFELESLDASINRAAAFVGQTALRSSVTTPRWAYWSDQDFEGFDLFTDIASNSELPDALRCFDEVFKETDTPRPSAGASEEDPKKLKKMRALRLALWKSPANGVVRIELGHQIELKHKERLRWKALRLYLEAAFDHPRLLVARYRVVTTLSLLAGDIQAGGIAVPSAPDLQAIDSLAPYVIGEKSIKPAKIFEILREAQDASSADGASPCERQKNFAKEVNERAVDLGLLDLAETLLEDTRPRRSRRHRMAWWAFAHVNERDYWLDRLGDGAERRRVLGQMDVLGKIISLRRIRRPGDLVSARWVARARWLPNSSAFESSKARDYLSIRDLRLLKQQVHYPPQRPLSDVPNEAIRQLDYAVRNLVAVDRDKADPGSGAFYNAACFFALASERANEFNEDGIAGDGMTAAALRRKATGYLNWARRAPGSGFPSAEWIEADPDFHTLRSDESYRELLKWTKDGERGLEALKSEHGAMSRQKPATKVSGENASTTIDLTTQGQASFSIELPA